MPWYIPKKGDVLKNARVVSMVPSITELLLHLDVKNVVGRTKFCIHPQNKVTAIKHLGGTKNPHVDRIIALHPDLIVANKEENRKEDIERLAQSHWVWLTDINNLEDFYTFVDDLAWVFAKQTAATELKKNIEGNFKALNTTPVKKALYLIWKNPYMAAGKSTFIDAMLNAIGCTNALAISRYPELSMEQIKAAQADVVFLSSEPFPFKVEDVLALSNELKLPVIKVDGELFSWYSQRLEHLPAHAKAIRALL